MMSVFFCYYLLLIIIVMLSYRFSINSLNPIKKIRAERDFARLMLMLNYVKIMFVFFDCLL